MTRTSWLPIPQDSDFSIANLPFGIISTARSPTPTPAVAIGDCALLLSVFAAGGGFAGLHDIGNAVETFKQPTLNAFASLGRPIHARVRAYLQDVLSADTKHGSVLKENAALQKDCLVPLREVTMHLPFAIGDYTDFYAGRHHAYNVGVLFRGPANALQPNYTHLPVGYHGRASSVVVSGTPIHRPRGQLLDAATKRPEFLPCRRLDIELELGAFVCTANALGDSVPISEAEKHIFGYVLLNDWSARDIQSWEYVPLGPFNSKNFATTISPWVVLADALEPFKATGIENDEDVLPYLKSPQPKAFYDIQLQVDLCAPTTSEEMTVVTRTTARNLMWSFPQMLAHHTAGGCPMLPGDLLGSGTISGTEAGSHGSLLEATDGGKKEISLADGEKRVFLRDGDRVIIRGWCGKGDGRVGFGCCEGQIQPSK